MTNNTTTKDANKVLIDNELEIYQILKPYIGHCLMLNHELNNLIAILVGNTEFLMEESENLNESQKKYIENISKCTEKIQTIITDLSKDKISLSEKIDLKKITSFYKNQSHSD